MEGILADWETCQEYGISDSDSNDEFDGNTGGSSVSDASVDPTIGSSRGICFTRHGDAPPSGASDSSTMNGQSSWSGSRISKTSLLGIASQSLQSIGDAEDMDFGECLIADIHLARSEKSSGKVLPCPIEGCRGKDPCISELL